MWLSNVDVHGYTRFVFDLEFIGDIEQGTPCYLWDIGCVCTDTGQEFSAVVMPPAPPAHIDAAFDNGANVTHARLLKLDAAPEKDVLVSFFRWIERNLEVTRRKSVLMMSHACFRSDSIVMDAALRRSNMAWPMPTLYFDTLLYMRHALRGTSVEDFSLQSIARWRGDASYVQDHRALSDARCLYNVLQVEDMRLAGIGLVPGSLSTTLIPGVGVATARALIDRGFTSIDALVSRTGAAPTDAPRLQKLLMSLTGMNAEAASIAASSTIDILRRFAPL